MKAHATSPQDRSLFLQLVARLLSPFARFCIRHSLPLQEVVELLKFSLVDAAREELRHEGKEISASRVSAMTGVHRKDIARFAELGKPTMSARGSIGRVMVHWQHDKRFTTSSGKPRALICEGRECEFIDLVNSVTGGDNSPYSILHEMERLGVVKRTGPIVSLIWRDFAPDPEVEDGISMLAEDVSDLYRSVNENIFTREKTPNFHMKTEFDNIPLSALPKIRQWILEEGSSFHRKIRTYLAKFDRDFNRSSKKEEPSVRVAFGSFSVAEVEEQPNSRKNVPEKSR